MGRVIVVGSLNIDLVVRTPSLPGPGQTVGGSDLARHQGGKGGNQAVAAARLGAQVEFVGAVGRDDLGTTAVAALAEEGVGVGNIARVDRPTGAALIVVDADGQNQIAVAPGANDAADAALVEEALGRLAPSKGDVLLVSREIPPLAVRAALAGGRARSALTMLNPAPADGLELETRQLADLLTPNESELAMIAGTSDAQEAGRRLLGEGGTRWLAVTLGARGGILVSADGRHSEHPALPVEPLDTTGAGDAFNGALAALLAAGQPPAQAMRRAIVAASLSTLSAGARAGMVTLEQLEGHLRPG